MKDGIDTLKGRVLREQHASDATGLYENVERIHKRFSHVFACPAVAEAERHESRLLDRLVPSARVLDYGCFEGQAIPRYLERGPRSIVGIDISESGIRKAEEDYGEFAEFYVADAHSLPQFEGGSFDLIVGTAILHHLDLDLAIAEIHRLLRPGGSALFMEPLGTNPLGSVWRALTPSARTVDEAPLSLKAVSRLDAKFSASDHYFCSILSTPVAVLTSLLPMSADNPLLRATATMDSALRRSPMRWGARIVYLHWIK